MTPLREVTLSSSRPMAWLTAAIFAASCGTSQRPADQHNAVGGSTGDAGAGSSGTGPTGSGADEAGGAASLAGRSGAGNAGRDDLSEGGTSGEGALSGASGDAGADDGLVKGRVIDLSTKRPLAGRTVVIGSSLDDQGRVAATTDQRGEFTLERPPGGYDAAVIEADGSAISVYEGLGASELVLPHRWAAAFAPTRGARVSGNVSGGTSYPLSDSRDVVAVHLFNDESVDRYLMGAGGPPYGPDYVAIARFDAAGPIASTLVALGTLGRKDDAAASDPAYVAVAATRTLALSDGDEVAVDLELEPIDLGEISGVVNVPGAHPLRAVLAHYRFPYPEAIVNFPAADYVRGNPLAADGAFVFELPKLRAANATLCVAALSDEAGALSTERCGISLDGEPVPLALHAPPSLDQPSSGGVIDDTTVFSWSPFSDGVHRLELWPGSLSPATPGISVFTAAAEAVLPDLSALGGNFPASAAYHVRIEGLGPAGSLDEALKPERLFAVVPNESRVSTSVAIDVTTTP